MGRFFSSFVVVSILSSLFSYSLFALTCSERAKAAATTTKYWGVVIPGLAISADEMPLVPGLLALENPEIGQGCKLPEGQYGLRDVAECHVRYIEENPQLFSGELKFIGMSMGGMILSIMASEFRSRLPERSQFHFFVTSPNSPFVPAIPPPVVQQWSSVNVKDFDSFKNVLEPMFSKSFLETKSDVLDRYVRFRMHGGNRQSGSSFSRQLTALRNFIGAEYFSRINPKEAYFTAGTEDRIFGSEHTAELEMLLPDATFREIRGMGHMINLERPDLFDLR